MKGRLRQEVFDLFAATGEWPSYRQVERLLVAEFPQIHDLLEKTFPALGDWGIQHAAGIQLSTRQILKCKGIDKAFEPLLRALPRIQEVYVTRPPADNGEIIFTHQDLPTDGWTPDDRWRLYNLLRYAPFTRGGGATPSNQTWMFNLGPNVLRYASATTAPEYLRTIRKDESIRRPSAGGRRGGHSRRTGPKATKALLWLLATVAGAIISVGVAQFWPQ